MLHTTPPLRQFTLLQDVPVEHGISNRHNELEQQCDVRAHQTHSINVAWVDDSTQRYVDNVDALLTRTPGVRLRVGVRDCTPIVLYDTSQHAGGVIHAGMQGTSNAILAEVLSHLNPKTTIVGIGPAIGACCYNDIDIKHENFMQALEAGVPAEQIEVSQECTKCNVHTYYSHRGGDTINFGAYFELNDS